MVKNYRPGGIGHLPAQPGTYLVFAYFDDNQVDLVKSNVVGWQVGSERILTPLVLDPGAVTGETWHVIHPDGRVECSDGRCWEDVDAWIVEERRLRRDTPRLRPVRKEPTGPETRAEAQKAQNDVS